jgi:hypothetical protein
MDYMLRTNTEEEMKQALIAAELIKIKEIDGEEKIAPVSGVFIDFIGATKKKAIRNPATKEIIVPAVEDSRFHANIRVTFELTEEQLAALPQVDPPPAIPYRVFA